MNLGYFMDHPVDDREWCLEKKDLTARSRARSGRKRALGRTDAARPRQVTLPRQVIHAERTKMAKKNTRGNG